MGGAPLPGDVEHRRGRGHCGVRTNVVWIRSCGHSRSLRRGRLRYPNLSTAVRRPRLDAQAPDLVRTYRREADARKSRSDPNVMPYCWRTDEGEPPMSVLLHTVDLPDRERADFWQSSISESFVPMDTTLASPATFS